MAITRDTIYVYPNYSLYKFKTKRIWRTDGKYEPFVYKIQEVETGMLYIGSKTARGCRQSDIGTKYFTSSTEFDWESNPEIFIILDIIPCASNHDALILESELIREHDAVKDEKYYNKHDPHVGWNNSGRKMSEEQKKKISESGRGLKRKPRSEKHRKALSESHKGKILSEETKKRISENNAWKGIGFFTGKKHSEETKKAMSESRKGRLPWNTGKSLSDEHKRTISENNKGICRNNDVTCPHCGKTGKSSGMGTWHFDNCRNKDNGT